MESRLAARRAVLRRGQSCAPQRSPLRHTPEGGGPSRRRSPFEAQSARLSCCLALSGSPYSPDDVVVELLVSTGVELLVSTVVAPDGATSA